MEGSVMVGLTRFQGERMLLMGGSGVFDDRVRHQYWSNSVSSRVTVEGEQLLTDHLLGQVYGSLGYLYQGHQDYQETGERGFKKTILGQNLNTYTSELGVMAEYKGKMGALGDEQEYGVQGKVGWVQTYGGHKAQILAARLGDFRDAFTLKNQNPDKTLLSTSLGLSTSIGQGVYLYLVYSGEFGKASFRHEASLKLSARF
jgi:uncharacterized protein with beta-barrel porin domain